MIVEMKLTGVFIFACIFISCGPFTKFTKSDSYTGPTKVSKVFVIVRGDDETKKCLGYYKDFLVDAFRQNGGDADGYYACCNIVMTSQDDTLIQNALKEKNYDYILNASIAETIVGRGDISSYRSLHVSLVSNPEKKRLWSGYLETNFSWFISDQHYRNVAASLSKATLSELQKKGFL
jgi:hypothetical protein